MSEDTPTTGLDALARREIAERAAYQIRLAAYQARHAATPPEPAPPIATNVVRLNDFRARRIGD